MNPLALGHFGLGQIEPAGFGRLAGPSRAALGAQMMQAPYAPVGSDRAIPGYPYGLRGLGYPPAPVPQGLPAQSYWAIPPYFGHTMGYKDALAAAGLEFHTEVFDLAVDAIAGTNIAAAGTRVVTVRISQEADFVVEKITEFSQLVGGAQPEYSVQVFDNATNRALSNIAVRRATWAGTAQRPRIVKPRLFRRNSDVSFAITNNDAAVAINILMIVMSGYKIFDPNALNLNLPQ